MGFRGGGVSSSTVACPRLADAAPGPCARRTNWYAGRVGVFGALACGDNRSRMASALVALSIWPWLQNSLARSVLDPAAGARSSLVRHRVGLAIAHQKGQVGGLEMVRPAARACSIFPAPVDVLLRRFRHFRLWRVPRPRPWGP
jgi:hypothetical protein